MPEFPLNIQISDLMVCLSLKYLQHKKYINRNSDNPVPTQFAIICLVIGFYIF
jgi:hypothetical protein